ncbi:MAG: multidrug transporter MatE [Methylibium sp. NZG]|nr:MAG: multidrug transporter MatE [Methylibium sp. NZG]
MRHNAGRIARLAWPVFIGQLAVLAFATVDTVMAARASSLDLAALAIGGSVYTSVFVGLMGVVLAIGPIAGQLFGARKLAEAGQQLHQAVWLALALSVLGCAVLLFPQPFLSLARAEPAVAEKVRGYLTALAFALPPALLFTAFRGFNTAVSRPKIVMAVQLGALALKVPLNALLVFGLALPTPLGTLQVPALGAVGCGVATAIVMAGQLGVAWLLLQRDPFYRRFALGRRIGPPHRASLVGLVRLGVPMGLSIAVEVTGFTFMAFFIARFGTTPVAAHQIALNLVSLIFMLQMAIGNATGTLVAQRIGAGDAADARRLGWHGVEAGLLIAAVVGSAVYLLREPILGIYTRDAAVIAIAGPLLAWVVLFHVADAGQILAAFVLRAYRVATVPLLVYVVAVWGVGLGGGYVVAFNTTGWSPAALQNAQGFWAAATAGLVVAAAGLCGFLAWMLRRQGARAFDGSSRDDPLHHLED